MGDRLLLFYYPVKLYGQNHLYKCTYKKASVTPSSFFLLRNSDRELRKLYFISRYALNWTLICCKNPQLMLEHLKMPGQATTQLTIQIQQHL